MNEERARTFIRNRVITARAAGAATQETPSSKTYAIKEAMAGPGLGSVFRTCWFVATANARSIQGRGERSLVSDQQRAGRRGDMCVFVRHDVQVTDKD